MESVLCDLNHENLCSPTDKVVHLGIGFTLDFVWIKLAVFRQTMWNKIEMKRWHRLFYDQLVRRWKQNIVFAAATIFFLQFLIVKLHPSGNLDFTVISSEPPISVFSLKNYLTLIISTLFRISKKCASYFCRETTNENKMFK